MNIKKKQKHNTIFRCQHCGYQSRKWLGKCPDCDEWDTLVEETTARNGNSHNHAIKPVPIDQAPDGDEERTPTGIAELDRVLGGGIVPGSVTLIGGEPGIGKSTIILHILSALANRNHDVLYISGEESSRQIKLRAKRLNAIHPREFLATESEVETIIATALEMRPALLAIDSIQTLFCSDITSAPGSVSQVRSLPTD